MSDDDTQPDGSHGPGGLPLDRLLLLLQAQEEYEAAFKRGSDPRIRDFLKEVPKHEQDVWFEELLVLDMELRESDQCLTAREYREQFPEFAAIIDRLFASLHPPAPTLPMLIDGQAAATLNGKPIIPASGSIGEYELIAVLGQGGMGTVYLARQKESGPEVALKVIRADIRPDKIKEVLRRFKREIRAAAGLIHEHVVPVYYVGSDNGRPFYCMKFVQGESFADLLKHGPLDPVRAVKLMEPVCRAIHHAHSRGFLHRDIKPLNIMIEDGTKPLVTDLGLAKGLEDAADASISDHLVGTPAYMSPEQARGLDKLTAASDVYSLGATLYEALTGRPPFRAATQFETLRQVAEEEPAHPRDLNPEVSRDLEIVCEKCLRKAPEDRYTSALELAEDLRRIRDLEPIQAQPVDRWTRLVYWARRNKGVAALSATVFILLAVTAVAMTIAFAQARQALRVSRESLVRQYLENGLRLANEGKPAASLPWLVQVMTTDPALEASHLHRTRVASVLRHAPKLRQIWALEGPVVAAEFSPDGGRVLAAAGSSAQVWNVLTGQPAFPPLQHGAPLTHASISSDGDWIVTAGGDSARVWNANTGAPHSISMTLDGPVELARFSPDGRGIAICGGNQARVWNLDTGQPSTPILTHKDAINSVRFSPDGKHLLVAVGSAAQGLIGEAVVWDLAAPDKPSRVFSHKDDVYQAVFSPDGQKVATASYDTFAAIWDAASADAKPITIIPHHHRVSACQFSPDGRLVASTRDKEVWLWKSDASGTRTAPPLRHDGPVSSVAFSPDGRRVATASDDRQVRVWDVETGEPILPALPHNDRVSRVSFSPDGRYVLSGGDDHGVRIWDVASGQGPIRQFTHDRFVNGRYLVAAALSRDGRRVVTGAQDGTARVWDAASGALVSRTPVLKAQVLHVEFSRDGRQFLTVSGDEAQVWDSQTASPRSAPLPHDKIKRAAFSPDGRKLVTAGNDNAAKIWDLVSGLLVASLPHGGEVLSVTFDAAGLRVLTTSLDGSARTWSAADGRPLANFSHSAAPRRAEFSPNGDLAVTGGLDRVVRVWNSRTEAMLSGAHPMIHGGAVNWVAFSPDGTRVASASADRTARVWDAMTGEPLVPPLHHDEPVNFVAFSPDGRLLVTGSGGGDLINSGQVRLFDAKTGDYVTLPSPHGSGVLAAAFGPDGQSLLTTSSRSRHALLWRFSPDSRPADELSRLASLLSGSSIAETGGAMPRRSERIMLDHRNQIRSDPGILACPPEDLLAWHDREAKAAEAAGAWGAAVEHLNPILEVAPNDVVPLARRAEAHANLGHWQDAERDFAAAIEAGCDDREIWYLGQILRLHDNHLKEYRATCLFLIDQFGGREDNSLINTLLYICTLAPDAIPDMERLVRLAEWLSTRRKDPNTRHTHAAVLLRAGNAERAIDLIMSVLAEKDQARIEPAEEDCLFLALAHARLKQFTEARRWFNQAERITAKQRENPQSTSWQDVLLLDMIRREAQELLADDPANRRDASSLLDIPPINPPGDLFDASQPGDRLPQRRRTVMENGSLMP